jgi:hypothetical protein
MVESADCDRIEANKRRRNKRIEGENKILDMNKIVFRTKKKTKKSISTRM